MSKMHKYIFGVTKTITESGGSLLREFRIFVRRKKGCIPRNAIIVKRARTTSEYAKELAEADKLIIERQHVGTAITGCEILDCQNLEEYASIEDIDVDTPECMLKKPDAQKPIKHVRIITENVNIIVEEVIEMARPNPALPQIGDIVSLADREGNHIGVVLNIDNDFCDLVLCTTNPLWNNFSRKLSQDEKLYFGNLFLKGRTTYFAPVKRSIRNIYSLGGSFPDYRVEELRSEFEKGFR